MELIEKNALMSKLNDPKGLILLDGRAALVSNEWGCLMRYGDVVTAVESVPTIDAEPVRHGRWMKCQGKSNIWYCSECGEKINYKQNRRTYNIPKVPVWQKNKRCRNCGAKMDGGAERC